MSRRYDVSRLVATVGGRDYELVPSVSCKGCAFEKQCYRADRSLRCPVFNDYTLASDIDVIFKEIKTDKGGK